MTRERRSKIIGQAKKNLIANRGLKSRVHRQDTQVSSVLDGSVKHSLMELRLKFPQEKCHFLMDTDFPMKEITNLTSNFT
jgi:hypothetical protein